MSNSNKEANITYNCVSKIKPSQIIIKFVLIKEALTKLPFNIAFYHSFGLHIPLKQIIGKSSFI
nr:hypothetical protein BAR15_160002 [Bartonella sp. AR 15-3]